VYVYDTEHPAIIDTGIGTNYELILEALEEIGIGAESLERIVPTHVHLDHAGGAGPLAEETGAQVFVHESGAGFLADPTRLWEERRSPSGSGSGLRGARADPEERITTVEGGDTIELGGVGLDVHHAPGHAFHQAVFHDADAEAVFAADAAGIYVPALDSVVETSPPPSFDLDGVVEDARMIEALDPETICYGHFGPAPLEDRIDEYVGVIERWIDAVETARTELDDDDAIVERFVERSDTPGVWGERSARGEIEMNLQGAVGYLDERNG